MDCGGGLRLCWDQALTTGPISVQFESSRFCSPLNRYRMDGESIKPRMKPSPGRVSSSFSPELSVITHPHARGLEQLGDGVQYGGEGGHYGGEFIAGWR